MKRLVLLLFIGLGWAAYSRLGRSAARRSAAADAFPFPTRDDHDAISLGSAGDVDRWCETLRCSESELRAAVASVGTLLPAVRDQLARSR